MAVLPWLVISQTLGNSFVSFMWLWEIQKNSKIKQTVKIEKAAYKYIRTSKMSRPRVAQHWAADRKPPPYTSEESVSIWFARNALSLESHSESSEDILVKSGLSCDSSEIKTDRKFTFWDAMMYQKCLSNGCTQRIWMRLVDISPLQHVAVEQTGSPSSDYTIHASLHGPGSMPSHLSSENSENYNSNYNWNL